MTGEMRENSRGAYPNIEVEILVVYGLDVEAYRWNCGNDFANLPDDVD